MSLSSGLTLTDLSDYLAPSQACIKPVTYIPEAPEPGSLDKPAAAASAEIIIGEDSSLYEKGVNGEQGKKLKKAEITLNDCLACSGCITSAESVLVSLQSHEEVYRVLKEQPELTPILSISPQSVASLAALYDLSLADTMRGLRRFFKEHHGFRLVFDTTFPRALSLLETRRELLERRAHHYSAPSPSLPALLAASTAPLTAPTKLAPSTSSIAPLPVLSSACPGWICYAEKTHGDLLPFVSGVKSPQAVAGVLVKGSVVAGRLGLRPDQIFHVAVMPCYDKKLEASRPDFATSHPPADPSTSAEPISVRDVDLVLTTGEVAKMLSDAGLSLRALASGSAGAHAEGEEEAAFFPFSDLLAPPRGTSSGSYVAAALSALLDSASSPSCPSSSSPSRAPTLSRADWPHLRLDTKHVRSSDYIEYTLVRLPSPYSPAAPAEKGEVIAKAAKCYGFRNLQNVVRKLSRDAGVSVSRGAAGRAPPGGARAAAAAANARRAAKAGGAAGAAEKEVEFVEVMACPGGCVNGGGQVAPPRSSARARRAAEEEQGYVGRVDDEGMPDVQGEVLEAELKLVADPAGTAGAEEGDRVLSAKEWVAEVERRYWSGSDGAAEEEDEEGELAALHPSIREYVAALPSADEARALEDVLEALLGPGDAEGNDERRKELLRTSYRAVQSEEVNGLAVVW
ncbi:Cytosolic Fe-S cluster assembly factor nar1 [Rhodotorula kratochvilovae]